ncbi:MAG: GNAT family N-acetyltransferase [Negativicutes bacterium]|nr:GNAT family N-acetyltransferase [Negativicutes bacterium]
MKLVQYCMSKKDEWDAFVRGCRNTHFFFQRDYMEYHADRFDDYSLMLYDDRGRLACVLPANRAEDVVYSHGGLTFGGFLIDNKFSTQQMLEAFSAVKEYLRNNQIVKLVYKCMPYIYFRYPSEEDRYALYLNNARLVRRDVSSTIYLPKRLSYSTLRKRMINKAAKAGLHLQQSGNLKGYWEVLTQVLRQQHGVSPVHTAEEITKLAVLFPENIKLYTATRHNEILAGALIYDNGHIVHAQYLANSEDGRRLGALDLVIHYLIDEVFKNRLYFDFGISNERQGRYLNTGLIAQKEGFGARAVIHDFYEIVIS